MAAAAGAQAAPPTLFPALGPGLVLAVLAMSGFVSSRADEQVSQPDSAITGVLAAFTIVPAVLVALSIPFIVRYGRSQMRTARTTEGSPA